MHVESMFGNIKIVALNITKHAGTMLLYATHRWPNTIHAHLWPYSLHMAINLCNNLPQEVSGVAQFNGSPPLL